MAVRVVEIVQAGCHSCTEVAPAVARVNAECGNPIEQIDGRGVGASLAARYGVSTTPVFLFLDGDREVRPRISSVVPFEQLKAAVVAAGRCTTVPTAPAPYTPTPGTPPTTPGAIPGAIPGGGSAPAAPATSIDVAAMPQDLKVRVLTSLAFENRRDALNALANEVAARGFSRAALRLRGVASRI